MVNAFKPHDVFTDPYSYTDVVTAERILHVAARNLSPIEVESFRVIPARVALWCKRTRERWLP